MDSESKKSLDITALGELCYVHEVLDLESSYFVDSESRDFVDAESPRFLDGESTEFLYWC
ncbi:hypothetical protein ACOI93_13445 [Corynebacterium striatum]|uniref:hypothetical protein n=1 Tax=Corynebacterium striatum TaxID=43770 RepID=UPI003B5B4F68